MDEDVIRLLAVFMLREFASRPVIVGKWVQPHVKDVGEFMTALNEWVKDRTPYPFCRHPEKCTDGRCHAEICCND